MFKNKYLRRFCVLTAMAVTTLLRRSGCVQLQNADRAGKYSRAETEAQTLETRAGLLQKLGFVRRRLASEHGIAMHKVSLRGTHRDAQYTTTLRIDLPACISSKP